MTDQDETDIDPWLVAYIARLTRPPRLAAAMSLDRIPPSAFFFNSHCPEDRRASNE